MKRLLACLALTLSGCGCGAAPSNPATPAAGDDAPVADTSHDLSEFPPVGDRLTLPDEEWRRRLSAEQYEVLREEGTERPFTGALLTNHEHGVYTCAACGAPLFGSEAKFNSGTGWPSFSAPLPGRVDSETDRSFGIVRTEVHCARCGGHLGHVFDDGPEPTGQRYCINSVSLGFVADSQADNEAAQTP